MSVPNVNSYQNMCYFEDRRAIWWRLHNSFVKSEHLIRPTAVSAVSLAHFNFVAYQANWSCSLRGKRWIIGFRCGLAPAILHDGTAGWKISCCRGLQLNTLKNQGFDNPASVPSCLSTIHVCGGLMDIYGHGLERSDINILVGVCAEIWFRQVVVVWNVVGTAIFCASWRSQSKS